MMKFCHYIHVVNSHKISLRGTEHILDGLAGILLDLLVDNVGSLLDHNLKFIIIVGQGYFIG